MYVNQCYISGVIVLLGEFHFPFRVVNAAQTMAGCEYRMQVDSANGFNVLARHGLWQTKTPASLPGFCVSQSFDWIPGLRSGMKNAAPRPE